MKNKPILIGIILAIFLLTFTVASLLNYSTGSYKMDIYLKQPDGTELKLKECSSKTENFECVQQYANCSETGQYYGKAITYYGSAVLSDSGWYSIYTC